MRFAILLLIATSLAAVQAAPVTIESEAAVPAYTPVKCVRQADGTVECSGRDSVEPIAASVDPEAFRPIPRCEMINGVWECTGGEGWDSHPEPQASIEPKAASVEPEAFRPIPRCEMINGVWECSGGEGWDSHSEPQASIEPKAASVDGGPVRCFPRNGVWECVGGNDPR